MKFPITLTHRHDKHAQIVVANAEQLAEVPEDFLPPADAVTAAAAIPGVNLADEVAALEERRKSLDEAVDEFTAHVQTETNKLASLRSQLDADRAQLDALHAQLEQDRAAWEALKNSAQPPAAGSDEAAGETSAAKATAEGAATGETPAAPAAPAKRTRATKEGA